MKLLRTVLISALAIGTYGQTVEIAEAPADVLDGVMMSLPGGVTVDVPVSVPDSEHRAVNVPEDVLGDVRLAVPEDEPVDVSMVEPVMLSRNLPVEKLEVIAAEILAAENLLQEILSVDIPEISPELYPGSESVHLHAEDDVVEEVAVPVNTREINFDTPDLASEERRKVGNEKQIMIDQNSPDYELRADLLYQQLFPKVLKDPDFIANEEQIIKEDEAICKIGRDSMGNEVNCITSTKSGKQAPDTPVLTAARKFRHLKILVLWLQEKPRFGNYCYYGCHCMPEGAHHLGGSGYGEPVDLIDRTCKTFNQCYACAKLGNGKLEGTGEQCAGEHTKYQFKLIKNITTKEKSIECFNKEGTCARHICECDKRMAEGLQRWEDEWDVRYHTGQNKGKWTVADNCQKKGLGRYRKPTTCCGEDFPDMKPKQEGKECCAHIPWDPTTTEKKCCPNGKLKYTC